MATCLLSSQLVGGLPSCAIFKISVGRPMEALKIHPVLKVCTQGVFLPKQAICCRCTTNNSGHESKKHVNVVERLKCDQKVKGRALIVSICLPPCLH